MKTIRVHETFFENRKSIGHFRVPKTFLFAWEWKMTTLVLKQRPGGTQKWPILVQDLETRCGYPFVLKRLAVSLGRNIGRLPLTTVTLPFKKDILHFSIPVLHSRHWIPPHPKQYLVDLSKVINTSYYLFCHFILSSYSVIVSNNMLHAMLSWQFSKEFTAR